MGFFRWLRCLLNIGGTNVNVENVDRSNVGVTVLNNPTIINRDEFQITEEWFTRLLNATYDQEIKYKYIPEIHQENTLERSYLKALTDFYGWKQQYVQQVKICLDYLQRFKQSFKDFQDILKSESLTVTSSEDQYFSNITFLNNRISGIENSLNDVSRSFNTPGYQILSFINQLSFVRHEIKSAISFRNEYWSFFLDKEPEESYVLNYLFQYHNQVYYTLNELNIMLERLRVSSNHMIIVGNAGTGKTHISAHLVNTLTANREFVIFLKSKYFNGDNVNFQDRLLEILEIPRGYTLREVLDGLNEFAKQKDKRCFIIIDALNETTKSSIGFSQIWEVNLQHFINQLSIYPNLHFVCTLRTSYINKIWKNRPSEILEIKGFEKNTDLEKVCKKYLDYYKIVAVNFYSADLSYFRIPLLLDLFCKLTNEKREEIKEITLNIHTYQEIFESYINELVSEVKQKLNLEKVKTIKNGFSESSAKFWENNEGVISVEEFTDAFDKDDNVSQDNSIARGVLEGYLIFIKDIVAKGLEIVKHTQQELGGYLLAKKLSEDFVDLPALIDSNLFKEKLVGSDVSKHHQLRLDVLKFLIALRPEIIEHLGNIEGLKLSWWYLYNGFQSNSKHGIPQYLVSHGQNNLLVNDILNISSGLWFRTNNDLNFEFISKILAKLDLWEFDSKWTFYIYNEADFFYDFVEDNTDRLKRGDGDFQYFKLVAKFISYVTSTTIRELRDLATVFLVEFGKRYPLTLLELTEQAASLKDTYIYERLVSSCYGVAMNLQNETEYTEVLLPQICKRLFDLQFNEQPIAPVYNYIVIDSIKHLIDLGVFKKTFVLNDTEQHRISSYKFTPPQEWTPPTEEQVTLINESNYMSYPDPIGMDFGIYTIPRLLPAEHSRDREAIVHVFKRIFELGYQDSDQIEFNDERLRDFYWGSKILGFQGKVDRLGKKYSWKSFFDYAGYLLLNNQLNVFEKNDDDDDDWYYQRLSDVDIDISLPNKDYKLELRIYPHDMLAQRSVNPEWYTENIIDSITPLLRNQVNGHDCYLLHANIGQRLNEGYTVRSSLFVDTMFIKKAENFDLIKESVKNKVFDWNSEVHSSYESLRNVYFGEIYWADNIPKPKYFSNESIPTGNIVRYRRKLSHRDVMRNDKYSFEDIGKEVEDTCKERINVETFPTLLNYLWESNSETLKGVGEYFPSIKMGKDLNLKAEPSKGKLFDSNLQECFHCIEFENEHHFSNSMNYMRSDLVNQFMAENNLALLYQVKQHSYDENFEHNRSLKFFILE